MSQHFALRFMHNKHPRKVTVRPHQNTVHGHPSRCQTRPLLAKQKNRGEEKGVETRLPHPPLFSQHRCRRKVPPLYFPRLSLSPSPFRVLETPGRNSRTANPTNAEHDLLLAFKGDDATPKSQGDRKGRKAEGRRKKENKSRPDGHASAGSAAFKIESTCRIQASTPASVQTFVPSCTVLPTSSERSALRPTNRHINRVNCAKHGQARAVSALCVVDVDDTARCLATMQLSFSTRLLLSAVLYACTTQGHPLQYGRAFRSFYPGQPLLSAVLPSPSLVCVASLAIPSPSVGRESESKSFREEQRRGIVAK